MTTEDDARWAMLGESFVTLVTRPLHPMPTALPRTMHRIPGPTVVLAERFTDSPVGPFLSLSVGQPVRLGIRPALHFGISVVSSKEARRLGRLFWGYPHQLGSLTWLHDGHTREMEWAEGGLRLTADVSGRPFPFAAPMRSFQGRNDGPVVVPGWARGMLHRSRVVVLSEDDGPLASVNGIYGGFALSGMVLHRKPARKPNGLLSTLRAPLGNPEPGLAGMRKPTP